MQHIIPYKMLSRKKITYRGSHMRIIIIGKRIHHNPGEHIITKSIRVILSKNYHMNITFFCIFYIDSSRMSIIPF